MKKNYAVVGTAVMFAIAGALICMAEPTATTGPKTGPSATSMPSEKEFMAVANAKCVRCHAPACKSVDELAARGWIKGGDAEGSPMFKHLNDRTPAHKVTDQEKAVIHDFIQGAKAQTDLALARAATTLLDTKCYGCHNHGWAPATGTERISWGQDVPRLIKEGRIVPAKPDQSTLNKYVSSGTHPGKGNAKTPTADEAKAFALWIAAGAPDPKTPTSKPATSRPAK